MADETAQTSWARLGAKLAASPFHLVMRPPRRRCLFRCTFVGWREACERDFSMTVFRMIIFNLGDQEQAKIQDSPSCSFRGRHCGRDAARRGKAYALPFRYP